MAVVHEAGLTGALQGVLLLPAQRSGLGVVVLGGSSGRVDVARARLLAAAGATAIALRWFGGDGQVPGICAVPLESFAPATNRLVAEGCDRIASSGRPKPLRYFRSFSCSRSSLTVEKPGEAAMPALPDLDVSSTVLAKARRAADKLRK